MRVELIIFMIAAFIIANIYTDGKVLKIALSWEKYYKMAAVAFFAFMIYWLIRKNPKDAHNIIATSNEYIKYLPLDRSTSSFINPILDFTSKQNYEGDNKNRILSMPTSSPYQYMNGGEFGIDKKALRQRIMNSGKTGTKRSVSETKKKYVAASQNWKCGNCQKQLPAWFEVDHKIRLEYGGSNHIDNLVALCRDCHGEKTAIENL
jgi:5-methylcytosine-specific restriction endonuclease McrA